MKKIFGVVAVMMMVGLGLTGCGDDELGGGVSKAEVVLRNLEFRGGYLLPRNLHTCLDSEPFYAPDGELVNVLVEGHDIGDGIEVEVVVKDIYREDWARFRMQRCKDGKMDVVETGEFTKDGLAIKDVTFTLPRIVDDEGKVARNVVLKYRGTVEKLDMLEY